MKKIIVTKSNLEEIQKNLIKSEVVFDSFLNTIEACLIEGDWEIIQRLGKLILQSRTKIAETLNKSENYY